MKIGITLYPYNEKQPAGLGRSIIELVRALTSHNDSHDYLLYCKNGAEKLVKDLPPGRWRAIDLGLSRLVTGFGFWRAPRADLYVFNTPVIPFFFYPRSSLVIVHDLAYIHLPVRTIAGLTRRLVLRLVHGLSLWRADHVVAVSYSTKNDLIKTYHLPPSKITVIYWGYQRKQQVLVPTNKSPLPFFLAVGVIKERKNTSRIVEAFISVHHQLPKYRLVIVGKGEGGYAERIKNKVKMAGLDDRVDFIGFVSETELTSLYQSATALVYPSLIEGFGFPVLEAMECGLPVITSSQSSLAEIGDGAAMLVSPTDVGAIARAMVEMTDGVVRSGLAGRCQKNLARFSWEATAKNYQKLFVQFAV